MNLGTLEVVRRARVELALCGPLPLPLGYRRWRAIRSEIGRIAPALSPNSMGWEYSETTLHGELIVQLTAILDVTAEEVLGLTGKADKRTAERARNRRLMSRLARAEAALQPRPGRAHAHPRRLPGIASPTTPSPAAHAADRFIP